MPRNRLIPQYLISYGTQSETKKKSVVFHTAVESFPHDNTNGHGSRADGKRGKIK